MRESWTAAVLDSPVTGEAPSSHSFFQPQNLLTHLEQLFFVLLSALTSILVQWLFLSTPTYPEIPPDTCPLCYGSDPVLLHHPLPCNHHRLCFESATAWSISLYCKSSDLEIRLSNPWLGLHGVGFATILTNQKLDLPHTYLLWVSQFPQSVIKFDFQV